METKKINLIERLSKGKYDEVLEAIDRDGDAMLDYREFLSIVGSTVKSAITNDTARSVSPGRRSARFHAAPNRSASIAGYRWGEDGDGGIDDDDDSVFA